jgi:cytochrome c peroxidase
MALEIDYEGNAGAVSTAHARQRNDRWLLSANLALVLAAAAGLAMAPPPSDCDDPAAVDDALSRRLDELGFTGRVEQSLEERLGRAVQPDLAELGRLLFFDVDGGLHDDNTCAGCHSPTAGTADTQSIAIGVQNNGIVGPGRTGPRNQRRSPSVSNTAFYPKLMWNGRFFAPSGDPFDASLGFTFPDPEGTKAFLPNDASITHLLIAQAHIPPTELVEAAGFTGTRGSLGERFDAFDDGLGGTVPDADDSGFRNEPIRREVLKRLNQSARYRGLFGALFPVVRAGGAIDFSMFARAIAEFEFTLVSANAPIDRYARGERDALTPQQKRGANLFFGKAGCVACHAVSGESNEMFSDFEAHNIGVPQIAPIFGVGRGNVIFDGPDELEDYGLAQVTGLAEDRYKFRTSPLRNVGLQPTFFHNGAFTRLEDAIAHHLDVVASACGYEPIAAGVDEDLTYLIAPPSRVLGTLDPLVAAPTRLTDAEFDDLVEFVRDGLLDERAKPEALCQLIPARAPSGRALLEFEGCPQP